MEDLDKKRMQTQIAFNTLMTDSVLASMTEGTDAAAVPLDSLWTQAVLSFGEDHKNLTLDDFRELLMGTRLEFAQEKYLDSMVGHNFKSGHVLVIYWRPMLHKLYTRHELIHGKSCYTVAETDCWAHVLACVRPPVYPFRIARHEDDWGYTSVAGIGECPEHYVVNNDKIDKLRELGHKFVID